MIAVRSLLLALCFTLSLSATGQTKKSTAYFVSASTFLREGSYKSALEKYTLAIQQAPNVAEYYYMRGYTYDMLLEYDKGILDFDRSIKLNPRNPLAYNNRGFAYYNVGEYVKAMADYDKAISIDPSLVLAYSNRGLLKVLLSSYEEAIKDLTQSLVLGLNNKGSESSVYNLRGYCNFSLNYNRLAINDFTQAIILDPDYADAYFNRGVAKYNSGDRSGAYGDFLIAKRFSHPDVSEWISKYKVKKS